MCACNLKTLPLLVILAISVNALTENTYEFPNSGVYHAKQVGRMLADHDRKACQDEFFSEGLDVIVNHRVTHLIIYWTLFNFIWELAAKHAKNTRFVAHLSPQRVEQITVRTFRGVASVFILTGYPVLIFNNLYGCSGALLDAWVWTCAIVGPASDTWEWIRRWFLMYDPALISHHLGVILLGLCCMDFKALPMGDHFSFEFVLAMSNIGVQRSTELLLNVLF